MGLTVERIRPNIGARVTGIDLREPVDEATMAALRAIWLDHTILLLPDQAIDDSRQIDFSRQVGELEILNMAALQVRGHPEVYAATNLDDDGNLMPDDHPVMQTNRDNLKWHSDSSFKRIPAMASLLHARIVPERGGETCFASQTAAYAALDEATKREIDGLIGVHDFRYSRRGVQQTALSGAEMAAIPPVRHPLVRTHPETGRKSLFLGSHLSHIEGMGFADSRELIDRLTAHATSDAFTYEHRWQVGDLIWWDNRCALHRGKGFDVRRHRRRMHRTTVAGTGPVE